MIALRSVYLIPVAVLAACAGGTTMRVAQDDTEDGPVALAPAPETAGTDSSGAIVTDSSGPPVTEPRPTEAAVQQPAPSEQGYAPYGNSTAVDIRRIGQWTRTGIGEARRLVIRDANLWAEFWSELAVGARPAVDFSKDLVVAVAAGQQPGGGHEIAIDRVNQTNGELTIEVVETTPGPNCMTTASLSQPVDVVVVPGVSARSWSFVERKDVRGCR